MTHRSKQQRGTPARLGALLVGALFLIAAQAAWQPVQAQVTGISYTLSPTGQYTLFENDGLLGTDGSSGLSNGYFYGGQVGFGFGQYLELSGLYLLGRDFQTDFSDLNDAFISGYDGESQALFDALENIDGSDVDLRRMGGALRLNLGSGIGSADGGQFLPYVTVGTGILRFDPEGVGETDNIYATGGVGFTVSLQDRLTLSLGGELLAYRYNFGRSLLGGAGIDAVNAALTEQGEPTIAPADFSSETVISPSLNAAVRFYLGGRSPGELSEVDRALMRQFGGGGGPALFIEPFYGRIEFNDALGFPKDQNVAGVNAGLQFGPYVGIRGFYWRGTEGDDVFDGLPGNAVEFEDIAFYGGELNLRFGSQFGMESFTPYAVAGAGYMDALSGYGDDIPAGATGPEDRYFAIGGAGVEVPLSSAFKLQGGIRYLLMSNSDVADVSNPDQVYGSPMYTAGIEINLGGDRGGDSVGEILDARAERRTAQQRAEFIDRDQATRQEVERLRSRIDSLEQVARRNLQEGDPQQREQMEQQMEEIDQLQRQLTEQTARREAMRQRMRDGEGEERMQADRTRGDRQRAPRGVDGARGSYLSGQTVTLPVPEVGEIYVRIGETSDDVQVETVYGPPTVVQGGGAPAMQGGTTGATLAPQQIRQIVRETIQSEMARAEAGGQALSDDEVRRIVEDVISAEIRRSGTDAAALNMQRLNNRLEAQDRQIRRLRDELDDELDQIQAQTQQPQQVIIEETEDGEETQTRIIGGLGGYSPTNFVPMAGYTVGGANRFLLGVRGDYGGDARFQAYGFRFAPEIAVGFGDGVSLDLIANGLFDLNFVQQYVGGLSPYAGAGLGLTTETGFGINLLGGVEYEIGSGAVFGEFSTLSFFDYNRFLVGYRARF